MGFAQILTLPNSARSRARFFQSHGVELESAVRSRSGVRHEDGRVVFALSVARVRVDASGCSCLLWTITDHSGDYTSSAETLRHCRLAARHGVAEGFLLGKDNAPVERLALFALLVVKRGEEYWARWGHAARAEIGRAAGVDRARSR